MRIKKKLIYIIIAFFCMGCDHSLLSPPFRKIVVSDEILQKKSLLENYFENNISQHEDIEYISRTEFFEAIQNIKIESNINIENKEILSNNEVSEEQEIKDRLIEKISKWYETNDVKYLICLFIFVFFMFILVLYWFTRLINKLSPKRIGFTFVWVLILFLIMIGIMVWL